MPEIPIACTLGAEGLAARRQDLLPGLVARAAARETLADGIRLQFAPSSDVLRAITSVIDAERRCCRFLRFELLVEAADGPIGLTVTGPPGTGAFLRDLL